MHGGKKGFHYLKKICRLDFSWKCLVKQILTPPLIAVADQPHQLPRGVQCEGPRPPCQFETSLFWRPVALTIVAAVAAGHQILPGRTPAARPWHHMVQRQFRTGKN